MLQVDLANHLYESLRSVPNVRIYGPAPSQTVTRAALCSFNVEGIHPTDIATFLDQQVCNDMRTPLIFLLDGLLSQQVYGVWPVLLIFNATSQPLGQVGYKLGLDF